MRPWSTGALGRRRRATADAPPPRSAPPAVGRDTVHALVAARAALASEREALAVERAAATAAAEAAADAAAALAAVATRCERGGVARRPDGEAALRRLAEGGWLALAGPLRARVAARQVEAPPAPALETLLCTHCQCRAIPPVSPPPPQPAARAPPPQPACRRGARALACWLGE